MVWALGLLSLLLESGGTPSSYLCCARAWLELMRVIKMGRSASRLYWNTCSTLNKVAPGHLWTTCGRCGWKIVPVSCCQTLKLSELSYDRSGRPQWSSQLHIHDTELKELIFLFEISKTPDYVFFPAIMTIWSPRLNHCVPQFIFDLQICYLTVSLAQKNLLSAKSIVLLKSKGLLRDAQITFTWSTGSTLFRTIKIDVCSPFTVLGNSEAK